MYTYPREIQRFIGEGSMEFREILSNQDTRGGRIRAANLSICLKTASHLGLCHHEDLGSTSEYLEISCDRSCDRSFEDRIELASFAHETTLDPLPMNVAEKSRNSNMIPKVLVLYIWSRSPKRSKRKITPKRCFP